MCLEAKPIRSKIPCSKIAVVGCTLGVPNLHGEVHAAQQVLDGKRGLELVGRGTRQGFLQLGVLGLGLLEEGDAGVSIFPEG